MAPETLAHRYEVVRSLGRGGMGDVLLVRDLELSREVALKRLHLHDAEAAARFRDEFSILARIEHPNIVRVFDFGVLDGDEAYYTLEFLDGDPIDVAIPAGNVGALLDAIPDIAAGLDVLHEAGIFHCDLKPSNILMVASSENSEVAARQRVPRLLDFGLAGWRSGYRAVTGTNTVAMRSTSLTASPVGTQVRGTPGFVSPEVLAGTRHDRASDLYALGATLYQVMCGRPAFPGRTAAEIRASQDAGRPSALPLRAAGIPTALEQAVLAMLEPDPAGRSLAWADVVRLAERHAGESASGSGNRGAFVGRDPEVRRLRSHLLRDGIQLSVIRGTLGSGRTRLAREVSVEAELAGWRVSWFDLDRLPDFAPEASPAAEAREESGPTLLVLDDVDQWPAGAVRQLDFSRRTRPFSILAIVQTSEASDEWIGSLLSLPEDPSRRDVLVEGLSEEAIARMARGRLGGDFPLDLVKLLIRHAGTLPDPLHRAMDSLVARPDLRSDDGSWIRDPSRAIATLDAALDADSESELLSVHDRRALLELTCSDRSVELPPDVAAALQWRNLIERSGQGWKPRSSAAADRLRASLLARVEPDDIAALKSCLQEPSNPTDGLATRVRRVQGEIELALGNRERARVLLCEAIRSASDPNDGDATAALNMILERLLDSKLAPDPILLDLSRHFAALGQDRRVAELLELALRGWDRLPAPLCISAAHDRARALHRLGDYQTAQDTMDAVASRLEDSGFAAGEWFSQRAFNLQFLGRFEESRLDYEMALARTSESSHPARAAIMNRFAMMTYLNLDSSEGRTLLEAARAEDAHSAPSPLTNLIRVNFALIASLEGNLEAALAGYRAGVEVFERSSDHARLGQGLANYANAASVAGEWELLDRLADRASRIARERNNPQLLLNVLATRANAAVRRGRVVEARSIQRSERAWLSSVQRLEAKLHFLVHRAETLRLLGREGKALKIIRRILQMPEDRSIPRYTALALIVAGQIEGRHGRVLKAEASLLRALSLRGRDIHVFEMGNIELARLAAWSTTTPSVLQAIDQLLESRPSSCAGPGLKAEARGWQALLSGSSDGAEKLFDQALDEYRKAGLMTLHIELGRVAGLAFAPSASRKQAVSWLSRSLTTARSLRMTGLSRRIADELFELMGAPSAKSPVLYGSTPERDTLYRVSEILNSALDPSNLLPRALALVCERIGAERGFILLTGESGEPRPVAQFGQVDDESRASALEVSGTVIRRVTSSGEPFHSDDATSDPRLGSTLSILDMSVRSLLCVPLRLGNDVIGTLYSENRSSAGQFDEDQVELLEAFGNLVAVAIQNARLHEELRRAKDRVVSENLSLRRVVGGKYGSSNLIGQSSAIERIQGEIERIAQSKATVLITGESGTGKDLVAKALHFASPRAGRPFLSLNCAALPADLIESELFGIEARVATGVDRRLGIFERADGGTLLLDEIGDMPLDLQAKLLRVLQDREFTRIGGSDLIRVDVRLIAATNQDLQDLIRERKFREDLFFRIHTLPIHLPPLRERRVDVPLLANHFLLRFCEENGLPAPRMSASFTETLLRSQWPGNVRELQNYIERSIVMSPGPVLDPLVQPSDLEMRGIARPSEPKSAPTFEAEFTSNLKAASRETERSLIQKALEESSGNQRRAAAILGIPEPTLRYRMRRLGISRVMGKESTPRRKPRS